MYTRANERHAARPSRSRGRARFLYAAVLTLIAGTAAPLYPQALSIPVASAGRHGGYLPLDSAREIPTALARAVTLRARQIPLESAVQSIARQAGIGFSYAEDVVRSQTRVSLDLSHVSAARALQEAVRGTGWQVLYTAAGQVTLRREPAAPAPRTGEIGGTVTGRDGRPLAGATIALGGTMATTTTDARGGYSLRGVRPGGYAVHASARGHQDATARSAVAAGERTALDLRLAPTAIELEELVAIGYGSARRRDLTGSIVSVQADQVISAATPTASVSSALSGRVPGVQLVSRLGTPGTSATLQIRGTSSITARTEPLYVLDGIPISALATPLNIIDPHNVESVQILKDASATAIYGARGANGVVLINTRRGTRGRNQVTVESTYGVQRPARFIAALGARDFMRLVNDGLANGGAAPRYSEEQIAAARSFDYPRAMLQNLEWQPQQNHAVTVAGGDDLTRYLVSGSLLRQRGIVVNSGFERAVGRVNLDRQVSGALRVAGSITGVRSVQRVNGAESTGTGTGVTGLTAALMFDPTIPPKDPVTGQWNQRVMLNENFSNPLAESTERDNPDYTTALLASVVGEYDLLPGLSLRASLAGNFNFGRSPSYSPSTIASGNGVGAASQSSSERRELTNENTLTYRRPLGPGTLELLAGGTVQSSHFETFSAAATEFPDDQLGYGDLGAGSRPGSSSSAVTRWTLLSQLGRVNYNLRDRYLFTLTARRDGSSRFGANNKWAVFPSAAFAWRAIDEPFLRGQRALSDLKIRLSYGITGNQAIDPYQSLARLATMFVAQGDETEVAALAPTTAAANPDLKWETQEQYNVGADLGVLDNRVTLTMDLYRSNTRDLLLNTNQPWTTGFSTQLRNVGAVRNQGVELSLSTVNWDGRELGWTTALSLAANRNRVTELYGGLSSLGAGSSTQVGEPLNTFVGYRVLGLYQPGDVCDLVAAAGCAPGEYRLQDTNGDRLINDGDRVNLGNPQADFYGGFTNHLRVGRAALDAFFTFSRGNEIHNSSMRYLGLVGGASNERADRALARWTPTNRDTDVPRANINRPNNRTYSSYIEDGSFLRLQSLSLLYEVPSLAISRGAIQSARLTLTGQNLWMATRYTGWDPEQQAVDPGGYPPARCWNVGVQIVF